MTGMGEREMVQALIAASEHFSAQDNRVIRMAPGVALLMARNLLKQYDLVPKLPEESFADRMARQSMEAFQAKHCPNCGRRKGCTGYCGDMDCEHCYCYREGRDG